MKNAIILAAGKSNRFAPFTYEKPKGLFKVRGEVLIDRQIEQLRAAGVQQIVVVVGFMKERFFYLEEKYGVILAVNNSFATKGNLYSLYVARAYLGNTYICCADHYFLENPFLNDDDKSYRACVWKHGKFNEFAVSISDVSAITHFSVGGDDSYAMVGPAYFSESFSKKYVQLMEKEIHDFGVGNMFWEEFYGRHRESLTLYAKIYPEEILQEFESVDDLRQFDQDFLDNIDSSIIRNIVSVLHCNPHDILNIVIIQKGLTNVSFRFCVDGKIYVYRHPGGTAVNLVDRKSELLAQKKAYELGLDASFIHMDVSGWKLSYYVDQLIDCDLRDADVRQKAMQYLDKLHKVVDIDGMKRFDTYEEAVKLMQFAMVSKGNLFEEFSDFVTNNKKLHQYVQTDGLARYAVCHNDVYSPNYLFTQDKQLYLIDWEYAGINDVANDIACILCRGDYTDAEVEQYLEEYVGRALTKEEHRHYIACIAPCSFYWFCWGLYKGAVNDDDGFFFLPAYRSCRRYIKQALKEYEE